MTGEIGMTDPTATNTILGYYQIEHLWFASAV